MPSNSPPDQRTVEKHIANILSKLVFTSRAQIVGIGITIERIKDGKIVERWVSYDLMGMMQQLGAVPPRNRPGKRASTTA